MLNDNKDWRQFGDKPKCAVCGTPLRTADYTYYCDNPVCPEYDIDRMMGYDLTRRAIARMGEKK